MGDFATATSVERRGDRWYATLSRDWEVWGPNGGYLASIALRAAGAASHLPRPASIAIHYLNIANFDEVQLAVTPLKSTKRAQSLRVSMLQGTSTILEAMVWVVDRLEGLEHQVHPQPDATLPESLLTYEELAPGRESGFSFWRNFQRKPVDLRGDWPPSREWPPVLREWYRLTPRATFDDPFVDAGRALLMIDSLQWPAAAWHHAHARRGYVAPTIDLSVNFHRLAPAEEWLLCVAEAPVAHDGLIGGKASVWSRAGELLASGGGHLLCRAVPADTPGAA